MKCLEIKKGKSLVRIFNAAPECPTIDIYIDDVLVFDNLKYSEFTKYAYSESANRKVEVYTAGTKEHLIISEMVNVPDGELITVAVIGNLEKLSLLVISDHVSKDTSNEYSSARIIHLSPDTPGIDIFIDSEILFTNIEYKQGTRYLDFNLGKYHLKIVNHEDGNIILPVKINLNPDRIYTIYMVGDKNSLGVIQSVDGNTYVCK